LDGVGADTARELKQFQTVTTQEQYQLALQRVSAVQAYFTPFVVKSRRYAAERLRAATERLFAELGQATSSTDFEPGDVPDGWDCTWQLRLREVVAMLVLTVLPGLDFLAYKTTSSARALKRNLAASLNSPVVNVVGVGVVLYERVVLPFVSDHPRAIPTGTEDRGVERPPSKAVLQTLVWEGYLSKGLAVARQGAVIEKRAGAPAKRPTVDVIRNKLLPKYPPRCNVADALPSLSGMPTKNGGAINWPAEVEVGAEALQDLQDAYGTQSISLTADELCAVLPSLSRQAAAGVSCLSNCFLRNIFEGDPDAVAEFLVPFASAALDGRLHGDTMDLWLTSRVALLPKPQLPGAEPDFRPLGIGCALYRLINKAVQAKVSPLVMRLLAPLQLAVGVKDAGAILANTAQAAYNLGVQRADSLNTPVVADIGLDTLAVDMKNAYGTMRLRAIHRGLKRFSPQLLRWFLICHCRPNKLMISCGADVGTCQTGVRQGDPLASLYFACGLQPALLKLDNLVKNLDGAATGEVHATRQWRSAAAYADDINLMGPGRCILTQFDVIRSIIRDDTGMEINASKCQLLTTQPAGPNRDQIDSLALRLHIPVTTAGLKIMGIPVGCEEYAHEQLDNLMHRFSEDYEVLQQFTAHQQWTLMLFCTSQRPAHLQRAMRRTWVAEHMNKFDVRLTQEVMRVMGVQCNQQDPMFETVHHLRGLPLRMGGASMRRLGEAGCHAQAMMLSRDRVGRFLQEHNPHVLEQLNQVSWSTALPVLQIMPKAGYDETKEDAGMDAVDKALKGHGLGNIPRSHQTLLNVAGEPQLDEDAVTANKRIRSYLTARNLCIHSQVMTTLRANNNKQLAAQCLSASCPGSGWILRWMGWNARRLAEDQFQQYLRMRLAVPCVTPLAQWDCDCRPHCAAHRAEEGDIEGRMPDRISLQDEPLHGLLCRRSGSQPRIVFRHTAITKVLYKFLVKLDGAKATMEPLFTRSGRYRADIMLIKGTQKYFIDIMITCPATARRVAGGSAVRAGVTAVRAYRMKKAKYERIMQKDTRLSDAERVRFMENVIPFVMETGGRIHPESRKWLESVCQGNRATLKACYRALQEELDIRHSWMLAHFVRERREAMGLPVHRQVPNPPPEERRTYAAVLRREPECAPQETVVPTVASPSVVVVLQRRRHLRSASRSGLLPQVVVRQRRALQRRRHPGDVPQQQRRAAVSLSQPCLRSDGK
jgi:hypothetical protein